MAFEVFISYAHEDLAYFKELEKHLANLKRQNIIASWFDGNIIPGTEWESQIMERLNSAQIKHESSRLFCARLIGKERRLRNSRRYLLVLNR